MIVHTLKMQKSNFRQCSPILHPNNCKKDLILHDSIIRGTPCNSAIDFLSSSFFYITSKFFSSMSGFETSLHMWYPLTRRDGNWKRIRPHAAMLYKESQNSCLRNSSIFHIFTTCGPVCSNHGLSIQLAHFLKYRTYTVCTVLGSRAWISTTARSLFCP